MGFKMAKTARSFLNSQKRDRLTRTDLDATGTSGQG